MNLRNVCFNVVKAPIFIFLLVQLIFVGAARAGEVKVSAAASLTDVLTELSKTYEKSHPDIAIRNSFAGSSTLAKQIENGAPVDIFISADKDWMDYLQKRSLLNDKTRQDLLSNNLVIISPANQKAEIQLDKNFDIANKVKGKLCTGEPAYVPVGKYAKQALEYYGWWKTIEPRVVGTEDVRTALAFVARGECALGIVYETDARMSDKVTLVARFPAESHLPIVYPVALMKKSGNDAQAFLQYLQSAEAAAVFNRYGFIVK
jgi:molybdate transport system substrate-binding protein